MLYQKLRPYLSHFLLTSLDKSGMEESRMTDLGADFSKSKDSVAGVLISASWILTSNGGTSSSNEQTHSLIS